MDTLKIIETLRGNSYFSGLSDSQLEKIAKLATVQDFPKGATILKESEIGDSVLFVVEGRVEVSVSLAGKSSNETIATLGEGQIVGEMILLGKSRRTANVFSKDPTKILNFKSLDLTRMFEEDFKIGYVIMKNIASQMAERLTSVNQVLRNALSAY